MSSPKISNDSNTTRIAVLETTATHIHEELAKIEKRFDKVDRRLDVFEKNMSDGFIEMRKESSSNFKWLLSLYLGGFGAMLAVMAHGFHWL